MDVHVTDIVIQNLNGKPCNTKFLTGARSRGQSWGVLGCVAVVATCGVVAVHCPCGSRQACLHPLLLL